jgi:P27 family predicted phage terminase small subunit
MAGTRQPVSVLQAKGRKHLTKAEIENRKKTEINAKDDNVKPPSFLGAKQKKRFTEIANELLDLKIMANIDCEALGRLIVCEDEFVKINKELKKTPLMVPVRIALQKTDENGTPVFVETEEMQVNPNYDKLQIMRGRVFKECRQGAADFGLTVSSRCRLAVPVSKDPPPENKFMKFAKAGNE